MVNVCNQLVGSITGQFSVLVVVLIEELIDVGRIQPLKEPEQLFVARGGAWTAHHVEASEMACKGV